VDPTLTDFAGWALIAGPVVFLVGAAGWDPRVFQGELEPVIRNIATRRRRWTWINAWIAAGTIATTAAIGVWLSIQRVWPATVTAGFATLLFLFATAGFLVAMAVRHEWMERPRRP
jgi:hypothetical protein